jgi:hypothetical protein
MLTPFLREKVELMCFSSSLASVETAFSMDKWVSIFTVRMTSQDPNHFAALDSSPIIQMLKIRVFDVSLRPHWLAARPGGWGESVAQCRSVCRVSYYSASLSRVHIPCRTNFWSRDSRISSRKPRSTARRARMIRLCASAMSYWHLSKNQQSRPSLEIRYVLLSCIY